MFCAIYEVHKLYIYVWKSRGQRKAVQKDTDFIDQHLSIVSFSASSIIKRISRLQVRSAVTSFLYRIICITFNVVMLYVLITFDELKKNKKVNM